MRRAILALLVALAGCGGDDESCFMACAERCAGSPTHDCEDACLDRCDAPE